MPEHTFSDGRTVKWSGANICICTKCEEIFNSVAAFNHHLKYSKSKKGHAIHDVTGMPRNSRGYLVTSLNDQFQNINICKHCGTQLGEEDLNFVECPYCGEEDYDDGD